MASPLPWQQRFSRDSYLEYLRGQRVSDRAIAVILTDASRHAESMVRRTMGDGIGARIRREQYRSAALEIRREQNILWERIGEEIHRGAEVSSRAVVNQQERVAEFLSRVASQEGIPDADRLMNQFPLAARQASENIRSRYLNNIDLSPRVYRNSDLAAGRIDRIVDRGIATSKSAREIARDVRGLIRPDTPGGVSYAAKRLARTEINNAFHATQIQSAANSPFVEAMEWNLSGSHPRPDDCDDLADMNHEGLGPGIFTPTNVPPKPHPQCLCFTTSVTVRSEKFANDLLSGEYDSWLESNGYRGFARSVA